MYQNFSDFYTSESMKSVLVEGIKLKDADAQIKKRILGVTALAAVIILLTVMLNGGAIPIILIIAAALTVCYVFKKKMGAFRKYYYNTVIPSVGRIANMELHYKDNRETNIFFQKSPLSSMFYGWTACNCYGSVVLDTSDYGIHNATVGHMKFTKKERDEKRNKVRTITLFDGLMYHIPVKLGLTSDISIVYERSALGKLAEYTGRTIFKSKKIFTFTNSDLEKHFDCEVAPHRTGLKSAPGRNEAYDEAHLEASRFFTASTEEFLSFIFKNYGPFDLLIRKSGLYLSVYGDFEPGEQTVSGLPYFIIKSLISRALGVNRKKLKGSAGHLGDFLNANCFGDTLKFEALNNNYEICRLAEFLIKYIRNPEAKDNYTEIVKDDFDYFDRTLKMKAVSAKELNQEYDSYYNSLAEKSGLVV